MSCSQHLIKNLSAALLAFFSLLLAGLSCADNRRVLHADSPPALLAIGKLAIPSTRFADGEKHHYIEHCSASILEDRYKQRRWLLSAWHCLEHYSDLGKRIVFRVADKHGQWHQRDAYIITHGGSMASDWALLTTETSLPEHVTTLDTAPYRAGAVMVAGFSSDKGLGQGGEVLTYQENCLSSATPLDEDQVSVDCWAFRGASGGAVLQQGKLVGVISQGDNAGSASFVDHAVYADRVARAMP